MKKPRIPQPLKHSAQFVRFEFRFWLDAGMVSTLGDLLRLLQEVEEEMMGFNEDDLIVDHRDELGVTTDYINLWGDFDEEDNEDRLTFSYRLANVEEEISHVDRLIECLGESYKISDLPMPKYGKKKPKVA